MSGWSIGGLVAIGSVLSAGIAWALATGRALRPRRSGDARAGRAGSQFLLVVIMLAVLTVLVLGVLFMPLEIPSGDAETSYADLLEYRRNVLSILLTVFGAWVGAGAAYFFGQENFREAASSLLQMRDASPIEILRRTPLRNLPPRPITWVAKPDQKLTDVVAHLRATSGAWFVPIVDDQGKLAAVVHQDGVWRFVMDQVSGGQTYADALDHTVQEVLDALTGDLARLRDIHVVVNMDKNASDVYALLQRRGTETYLAVITDEAGRPTHFVTTGDVRRVLLDAQITAI